MTRILAIVLGTVLLAACAERDPVEPGDPFFAATNGTATVLTFDDHTPVGTSRLVRNDNGVSAQLSTRRLEPGTTATLWMVIFNAPANCSPPGCGEDDLFEPAARVDVLYAAGSVIGGEGGATFAGHRSEGDNTASLFAALGLLPAPGLIDAGAAEIHLVVRSHGLKIPGLVPEMIRTFNGGCVHPGPPYPDPLPPQLGAPGPNTCVDVQFAVHQP